LADYTILSVGDVPDASGDYPGEMHFFTGPLEAEQVAFTFRRMPPQSGGKGSYGHSHKTQEELVFVISGNLQFKIGDEVIEVGPRHAVRLAPSAVRSIWNDSQEDAEIIIVSTRHDNVRDDVDLHEDFWPE
jgi:uncharacterized cupin superfamily protein